MLAELIEVTSVAASADTRFTKPLDYPRPRYPEPTPEPTEMGEVAAFFGMVYVPAPDQQEETAE